MRDLLHKIRRFIGKIRRVIDYIPVVWKLEDFDYRYSIDIFKKQLERQVKFLESDKAMTLEAPVNAQKIKTVIRLMDKVYDGDYGVEYINDLEHEYGKGVLEMRFFDIPDKPGYSRMKWAYEVDDIYEPYRDEIRENHDKWFKESQEKQERAHKLLWEMVEFYIRRWWD